MIHDEQVYTSPDDFNPDRYISTAEGGLGESLPKGESGFGRRICAGQHLAEVSAWIVIASLLSIMTLEWRTSPDTGVEKIPVVELVSCLTSHPKSFKWVFRPRTGRI